MMKNKLLKISILTPIIASIAISASYAQTTATDLVTAEKLEVPTKYTESLGGEKGEVVAAYRVSEKGFQKLDNQELIKLKAESKINDSSKVKLKALSSTVESSAFRSPSPGIVASAPLPPINPHFYSWEFIKQGGMNVIKNDLTARVSTYARNDTLDNLKRTLLSSESLSYKINISLNGGKKDALAATLGGEWSKTTYNSDSLETIIRPGYQSWLEFTPIMANTWGRMKSYDQWAGSLWQKVCIADEWTDLYMAREVNGKTDGIMTVKTAPAY